MLPTPTGASSAFGDQFRPNDGGCRFSPTGLVTGFGPFPGVPVNPSETLARGIAGAREWQRLGWEIRHHAFRTGYALVEAAIAEEAAGHPPPAFVVMIGVAARSKALRVELRAKNRVSATHRDATSARPASTCLQPGAETTRFGRHPGKPLVAALRQAMVPARLSRDTGRYVCNAAYWRMLAAMPARTEVVFIHIPLPSSSGLRKRDPRPGMAGMARGLKAVMRVLIARARIRR